MNSVNVDPLFYTLNSIIFKFMHTHTLNKLTHKTDSVGALASHELKNRAQINVWATEKLVVCCREDDEQLDLTKMTQKEKRKLKKLTIDDFYMDRQMRSKALEIEGFVNILKPNFSEFFIKENEFSNVYIRSLFFNTLASTGLKKVQIISSSIFEEQILKRLESFVLCNKNWTSFKFMYKNKVFHSEKRKLWRPSFIEDLLTVWQNSDSKLKWKSFEANVLDDGNLESFVGDPDYRDQITNFDVSHFRMEGRAEVEVTPYCWFKDVFSLTVNFK